jgi:hypothetical protein
MIYNNHHKQPVDLQDICILNHVPIVGFDVITAVIMKSSIFWDVTTYTVEVRRRFGGSTASIFVFERVRQTSSKGASLTLRLLI